MQHIIYHIITFSQRGLRGDLKNSSAIYGIATLRIFGSETQPGVGAVSRWEEMMSGVTFNSHHHLLPAGGKESNLAAVHDLAI